MTGPISATQSISSLKPLDLSRVSFQSTSLKSGAVTETFSSHFPAQAGNAGSARDGHVSLLKFDFSLEQVPLVGDFLSLVSDLFSSTHGSSSLATDQTSEVAYHRSNRTIENRGVSASVNQFSQSDSQKMASTNDLSALLPSLEGLSPAPINLLPDDDVAPDALTATPDAARSISGLAKHPSNLLPAETLQLLQDRYMAKISKEG